MKYSRIFQIFRLFSIRQYIQLLINLISGLIESGAEKHEKVTNFEHGIILHRAAAYLMEPGGVHIYLRFVGDVYVSLAAELATAY